MDVVDSPRWTFEPPRARQGVYMGPYIYMAGARTAEKPVEATLWTLPAHSSRRPHPDVSTPPHAPPRATQVVDKNVCVVTRVRTCGRRA